MTPPKRRVTGQQGTQAQPLPARTTERYTPPLPIIQPRRPWWSRLAWPVAILGIIVFVVGWIGAKGGAIAIPFDPITCCRSSSASDWCSSASASAADDTTSTESHQGDRPLVY